MSGAISEACIARTRRVSECGESPLSTVVWPVGMVRLGGFWAVLGRGRGILGLPPKAREDTGASEANEKESKRVEWMYLRRK